MARPGKTRRLEYEQVAALPAAMPEPAWFRLEEVTKLAAPADNAYIATRDLPHGAILESQDGGADIALNHAVLEGHRFARQPIAPGEVLTSWQHPFGKALCPIAPGEWLRNSKTVKELEARGIADEMPRHANFVDSVFELAQLDESTCKLGEQLPLVEESKSLRFSGFKRPSPRLGVGTRNFVVVLCVSSRTNALARAVEASFRSLASSRSDPSKRQMTTDINNLDGVVALPHTEGSRLGQGGGLSQHRPMLIRTLLGLLLHPNVGAALVLEHVEDIFSASSNSGVCFATIKELAQQSGRGAELETLAPVVIKVGAPDSSWDMDLQTANLSVRNLVRIACKAERSPCALSSLIIAQQCGGSDAFSGTCANPLVGLSCKMLIEHGGSALLAETDELIGAEAYILSNVANLHTARRFMEKVRCFHAYAHAHGASAEGNPSGGNLYRGLYNIALKSLGAAMKKHSDVRLERVLEYAEPILKPSDASSTRAGHLRPEVARGPGYCFMDSPGNDLESLAGQVASGCNLIFFTTGNGSITNFPFVPTIKIVSTHRRFEHMASDMDVDAGAGRHPDDMALELFKLSISVASGQHTKGESFGYHQIQIWRAWENACVDSPVGETNSVGVAPSSPPLPNGSIRRSKPAAETAVRKHSLVAAPAVPATVRLLNSRFDGYEDRTTRAGSSEEAGSVTAEIVAEACRKFTVERVGLVLPTSLCSSQVARGIAEKLQLVLGSPDLRFASLPHTEGCGVSDPTLSSRLLLGHLTSPIVAHALLLEHGCEMTHNSYFASHLRARGLSVESYGWASLQNDGGVAAVEANVGEYFASRLQRHNHPMRGVLNAPLAAVRVGLLASGTPGRHDDQRDAVANLERTLGMLAAYLAAGGGCFVLEATSPLLHCLSFTDAALAEAPATTLQLGEHPRVSGIHVVEDPRVHHIGALRDGRNSRATACSCMPLPHAESLAILGAAGVELILSCRLDGAQASNSTLGHPMVKTLSIQVDAPMVDDVDIVLSTNMDTATMGLCETWLEAILTAICETASGRYAPISLRHANTDFQLPRGGACSL